jgi:hypothetical protein
MAKLSSKWRAKKFTEDYTITVITIPELRIRMSIATFLFRLGAKVLGAKFVTSEVSELRDHIAELEIERDYWKASYTQLFRHINNLPEPPEAMK